GAPFARCKLMLRSPKMHSVRHPGLGPRASADSAIWASKLARLLKQSYDLERECETASVGGDHARLARHRAARAEQARLGGSNRGGPRRGTRGESGGLSQ